MKSSVSVNVPPASVTFVVTNESNPPVVRRAWPEDVDSSFLPTMNAYSMFLACSMPFFFAWWSQSSPPSFSECSAVCVASHGSRKICV